MAFSAIKRLFKSSNERKLISYKVKVGKIAGLEPKVSRLTDSEIRERVGGFRLRLQAGESIASISEEAFAVAREAAKRNLSMRPFDVQIMGGLALNDGLITEMRTGEGKTLVAPLAVYLNSIAGKGVHVVTVNDYLAKRDAESMRPLYHALGLSVGIITAGMSDTERRDAYHCDVTYATNNELGFDYLRDNMKYRNEDKVHRPFNFAIIDEVDSILIDEARTPLIISGLSGEASSLYTQINQSILKILREDGIYEKDEKAKSVIYTEKGSVYLEEILREDGHLFVGGLYDRENIGLIHHSYQALRANILYHRDTHYIVRDGKVILIDEFTGRMMEGRRFSDGLHQALEAKEGVEIGPENQTLASVTFQNFFRMYPKLAGMTGTALTEQDEFAEIYNLDVISVPTNVPVARIDEADEVYNTTSEKLDAIISSIEEARKNNQPVLVGTTSIEKSEEISLRLKLRGLEHQVLNARHHEREAFIVSQAGRPGSVTIATNMAGRGTDIKLGGNALLLAMAKYEEDRADRPFEEVLAESEVSVALDREAVIKAGGLYVIGSERHESRRIDNQLRGRSGRQGDPGKSKFFLSLDDDLMRIFGGDRLRSVLLGLGLKKGEAITHPWVNKALLKAQQRVESRNFDMRKNLLQYDDVMNEQRKEIYAQRARLIDSEGLEDLVAGMIDGCIERMVSAAVPREAFPESWDLAGLQAAVESDLGLSLPVAIWGKEEGMDGEELRLRITSNAMKSYNKTREIIGNQASVSLEKSVMLQVLDGLWKDHLLQLDHLRHGIGLRAYGQRDPLLEYKTEAFVLFSELIEEFHFRSAGTLLQIRVNQESDAGVPEGEESDKFDRANSSPAGRNSLASQRGKISRNSLCYCGSGQRFKHCHGSFGITAVNH
jgi:preprotein translocase subunit SecA